MNRPVQRRVKARRAANYEYSYRGKKIDETGETVQNIILKYVQM
jgi:hypothetical protein